MISLSLGVRIDAKRRSRGRGDADGAGRDRAPSLISPPVLEGTGRIGEALSLLPGRWEGLPVPALSVRWQRDGRDIPGATGFAYVPVPQDDGGEITAHLIARNTAGTASATSSAHQVTWPAPEARAPIANQFLSHDSGEHALNVSSNFDGGALRFSVTGEGVTIDPETGILSITTDALRDGVSVTVTAVNSGGEVAQTFRLDVAIPEIALPVAPEMVAAPVLPEIAEIGSEISVEAGTWSGTPAPGLTYQWLLDGVEIAGAVEVSYLPLASDDGNLLACRVTARNSAGTAEAVSSTAQVRHAPPLAAGGLTDLLLDVGSGPVTVAAGAEFSGENLVFSVTGAGAEIDSATGLVTISTDDLQTEEPIIVTASNSGGTAESSFLVTIKAAEVEEPEGPPAPLADGQWQILRSEPSPEIAPGSFRPVVSIDPNLGVEAAQWTTSAQTPALAQHWETLAPTGESGSFTTEMLNQGAGNWHVFTDDDASRRSNFRIRYRLAADGAWSAESAAKTVPLPEAVVLPAPGIAGTLADISAEQGTPALDVDAAAAFSGDELVFAVTGTGAEIDAGTGLLTISTDELRDSAEVVVTASNSGGSAEIRFQVDITAAAFVPVPPLMLAGPVLVGSAKVGTALTVETGSWGGDPAPGIACQWLRDGAPIEGAVGIEYLVTAEDDLAEIACRVTATNAGGSAEALTAAVTVTHVAPSAKGELFEEILDEGTGPQEIPTAQDFEGEALTFAVTGADATIDAATGIVSIPTDSPVDGATVTVTASNSGGEAESSFLVTIEAIVVEEPEGPPAPPTAEEIGIGPSVFAPGGQSTTFRPNFTPTGRLTAANVEIGWSTSLQNPPVPTQIEGTIETATAGTYTLTHRDGDDSQWTLFREGDSRRTDFLRFRWRVAGGEWSDFGPVMVVPVPPARVIPPAPVGVSITPGSGDGKIIMAADPQTEWGDGEAGELKMWSSATGEVTFAAGIWQLPEKAFGQTINVKVYAVDSDGFKGEEVTENVLVPGDAPKVVNSWAMMHFSSQRAFDNQQTYRYGKSAHQIQFCHGGVRSEANPNDACFIMDVGGPWVTENAEDDWPMYQLAGCAGLEVKNSVSSMWDPDIAGRLVHAVGERPSWPWQTAGSRTGIYTSDDKGANFTLRHNVFAESEFSDTTTRSYRQVLNYAPTDHNIWYFLSPKYNLSRSTNRGSNWSVINSNVSAMGQCWYLQPDYGNANTLWIASENGLFKSTNGGASVFRVYPGGLPGGAVTHLCFDPDNANNWMAVVGGVGIYRTTNGGSSFSRLPTPTQFVCQVFQSRANKNYLWYMGINRTLDGQWGRSTGAFSTNGGASWQTCSVKGDTYGIDRGSPDLMRAEWSGSENGTRNMATVILPSPTDPDRAIATWGHALWRTKNGVHWDNASDGFSNHAGGDVNFGAMEWVGNDILFAAFDKRGFASRNNGDTWYQMGFQGALPGVPVGFTMSRHATKPKVLTTQGYYNPNPGTVLLSYDMGVNAANSKRPAFFSQNYGSNDFQKWAHFHKTGAPNVAYCTTAYSQDEGETWTKWVDRADSVYRNGVGEPPNRSSRAGVRMCSPQDNDWLIAAARSGRGMFLSKNRGLTWRKFTDNGPAEYGSDMASLWMDPTDRNIIYWWREGVGMARYDERTQSETIVPGTVQYKNMRVQRIRSSYQNGNHIYFFNRQDGKPMVFRSTAGWQGQFEDISGNLPRQTGNQGFEIDPNTGILWMNGVIGSRIFPPPGGHPRFDVLAKRSRT